MVKEIPIDENVPMVEETSIIKMFQSLKKISIVDNVLMVEEIPIVEDVPMVEEKWIAKNVQKFEKIPNCKSQK